MAVKAVLPVRLMWLSMIKIPSVGMTRRISPGPLASCSITVSRASCTSGV